MTEPFNPQWSSYSDAYKSAPVQSVVICGSRSITQLPDEALASLTRIVQQGLDINIGDAPGVDTLVQQWLASQGYQRVMVWHIGQSPRNNIGGWTATSVQGRFTDRDKAMCNASTWGLAIWDGRSPGTKRSIEQLGHRCKVVEVL
jgi:adenine-specific DNA-methyltransferase